MKKHLLTFIAIAAISLASCEKDTDTDDNGANGGQNTNPYNTSFNVVVKTPITEVDSVYDEISWNTTDANALGEGELKVINAKDLALSSFTMGAFNISTGTQTVLAPSFIHQGQVLDLSDGLTGVIDVQSVDEVNQLISGPMNTLSLSTFNHLLLLTRFLEQVN